MFENIQQKTQKDDELHVQYSIDFTRTMTALEKQLHSCEDPSVIAMEVTALLRILLSYADVNAR